jgi:hypothetical protein
MTLRTVVWGTGNVGRPAVRAVLSHRDLELAGVVVSNPGKVGRDAGELAGVAPAGLTATDDWSSLIASGIDAVIYTATADTRPEEAMQDLFSCLAAGVNVISSSFYSFLHPGSTPAELLERIEAVTAESGASLLVSGIDPGWAMDALPIMLSGTVSDISEIRCREIFNYALYDQPQVVREVIGFGGSLDELPLMLHDFAIEMVWAPMLRAVGDALDAPVESIEVLVERRPLDKMIEIPAMGTFAAGTQGAFRFEVRGLHAGRPRYVLEHVTRIDDDCAPDWPYPPEGRGCHQVIIRGTPDLHVTLHAEDPVEPGAAGGGNASAASWLVNSVPGVCAAAPGVVTTADLAPISGAAQLRRS